MICPLCKGAKLVYKTDIMNARRVGKPCPRCRGRGEIVDVDPNGISISHKQCQVYLFQKLEDSKPVSTLEVHIRTVTENGLPIRGKGSNLRFYLEIVRMNTLPRSRKQGTMEILLGIALKQNNIEWAETSWNDSTPAGRKFLLKRGFVKENDRMVWERN